MPENRLCLPTRSVRDNLMLGPWTKKGHGDVDSILELFPRLRTRMGQADGPPRVASSRWWPSAAD